MGCPPPPAPQMRLSSRPVSFVPQWLALPGPTAHSPQPIQSGPLPALLEGLHPAGSCQADWALELTLVVSEAIHLAGWACRPASLRLPLPSGWARPVAPVPLKTKPRLWIPAGHSGDVPVVVARRPCERGPCCQAVASWLPRPFPGTGSLLETPLSRCFASKKPASGPFPLSSSVLSSSLVNKRFLDLPKPVLGKDIIMLGRCGSSGEPGRGPVTGLLLWTQSPIHRRWSTESEQGLQPCKAN